MNELLLPLKHVLFGAKNVVRILLGADRQTDREMRRSVLAGLVKYPETVDVDLCLGCGVCSLICPMKCITMKPLQKKVMLAENQYKERYPEIDTVKCMFCFQCHDNCPVYVVHHRPAAIHPRGIRKTGMKAEELFGGGK